MSQEPKNKEEGFMYKFASFIVDKRNLIFLIVAIGLVFSVFSRSWVQVENQLSAYLPKDSETYQGLHLMEDEFTTFGTAKLMLVNVSYDEAQAVSEQIASERTELEQQMAELDTTREELDQQEAELEAQRTEADSLLLEMMQAYEEMNADYEQNMADEAELSDEIAKSEAAYYAALSKEEAEQIKGQLEEAGAEVELK